MSDSKQECKHDYDLTTTIGLLNQYRCKNCGHMESVGRINWQDKYGHLPEEEQ